MNRPPRKFYIASSLENAGQVRQVAASLTAAGWEHTYDWTKHGSVAGMDRDVFETVATDESDGVIFADVVIVLLPGGRGTHVELGIAIGTAWAVVKKPDEDFEPIICVYSPTPEDDFGTTRKTCAFYHHPAVQRFDDLEEMVGWLLSE